MKTTKVRVFFSVLLVSAIALVGCETIGNNPDKNTTPSIIVILKYKAQPEKGLKAVAELTSLIEKVKLEPHFIEIKLHVDPEDNTNILLYEAWGDENYYKTDHMKTSHINEFMANSRNFLTGPPEINFWKIEKEFK